MVHGFPKRWLHPQSVPRGFLRLYILTLLDRGPETGYSIIQTIDAKTEGAWKPGPGTIYPLMKSLVSDGLAKVSHDTKGSKTKSYDLTSKGHRELEKMRGVMTGMGGRERILGRLFSDIIPASSFVPAMSTRFKEGMELFRKKISEVPEPERDLYLKDLRLHLESQIQWIDLQLDAKLPGPRSPPKKRSS
jgi:DNA-binding PadR family transcriptional regulator